MVRLAAPLLLIATLALSGCELLGMESPESIAARKEAEGKAVGGACRHAGRAIEDCYALNKKADKASVFAGWREMNDYMRENKIEPVPPQLGATEVAAKASTAEDEPAKDEPAKKPAKPKKHDS